MGNWSHGVTALVLLAIVATGTGCDCECEEGTHCWDLNGNGVLDPEEDVDDDGVGTALDCRGPQGNKGEPGEPGQDGKHGKNGEDGNNGNDGKTGEDGTVGQEGLNCWDLNENGIFDEPEEDIDGDEQATAMDCQGPVGPWGASKGTMRLALAGAYCAALKQTNSGSGTAVALPEQMPGQEACGHGPEANINPYCYGAVIVHASSVGGDFPDYAIFNPKSCDSQLDVAPGSAPYACCGGNP